MRARNRRRLIGRTLGVRTVGVLAVGVLAVGVLAAGAGSGAEASGPTSHPGATGVWSASLEGVHGLAPDATVRQLARVSVPASRLRVRFGNPFGAGAVVIEDAWMGRPVAPGSARLTAGSNRRLTFHGRRSVTIPAGHEVVSDPVAVSVEAQQDVAVSVYAPGSPVDDHTFPPYAYDPPASYIGSGGDTAAAESDAAFPSYPVIPGSTSSTAAGYHPGQTWWMDLITADRAEARGTLVALGDSITDGYNAYGPPGQRWTDVLADRLDALPARQRLAVANAGISGNTVSVQPNPYDATGQCCGPPAPERLDRDVLGVPGLRTVLLLEGTNDLGGGDHAPPAPADQVIGAMRTIAGRVHARHTRVVASTILPMCNAAGSAKEKARLAVNDWIRTSGTFDAVLDFDAVLRDPADPTVMVADLRTDCYHPNAAGDQLIGRYIPLTAL
jgi:lysophospholipase L1-like esterase